MEYLCQGMKHYTWGTEARLQDPEGNEGFLKITTEQQGSFKMPEEGMPYEYEGELCESSSPHAPAPEEVQVDPPGPNPDEGVAENTNPETREPEGDVLPGGGDPDLKGFDPPDTEDEASSR